MENPYCSCKLARVRQCAHGPVTGGHSVVVFGAGFIDEDTGLLAAELNRAVRFGHHPAPIIPAGGSAQNITVLSPPGTAGAR